MKVNNEKSRRYLTRLLTNLNECFIRLIFISLLKNHNNKRKYESEVNKNNFNNK